MPGFMDPGTLDDLIQRGDDASFLIVDVRQPWEYALDHIPGAVNIPVAEVEENPALGAAGQVIFYCRNGMRSKVAAILAVDAGLADERVFSLHGGMAAYTGEILLDLPAVALFDDGDVLVRAIDLEKGAWRFYVKAAACSGDMAVKRFFAAMAGFETEHARALFNRLALGTSFRAYFGQCSGEILEGGRSLDRVLEQMAASGNEEQILDLALDIELAAYDLYKRTGYKGTSSGAEAKEFFLGLAQEEKRHLARVLDFMDKRGASQADA